MNFNSNVENCDVVIKLNKILYVQSKDARLWYENDQNGLLECGFVVSKVDYWLFRSNHMICVAYMDDCLFWACLQSIIDKVLKYFKEDWVSHN